MIWRSLICFSFALFAAFAASGATLSGTVVLRDSRVPAVNKQNADFSGVVVSAQTRHGPDNSRRRPRPMQPCCRRARCLCRTCCLSCAGITVDFPNFDPIFHNAFSSYSGQIFDIGLYPPGTSRSVRITRLGVLQCLLQHPSHDERDHSGARDPVFRKDHKERCLRDECSAGRI